MSGRHRDPDATVTGPLRRPSRQQLVDVAGQFRWPTPPPSELPATGWDQAVLPTLFDEPDEDQTVQFSLADLGASTGATLLPVALSGPDPAPRTLAPWQTGEMQIVPAPADVDEPSLDWLWALAAALITAALVLLGLVLAPGGA